VTWCRRCEPGGQHILPRMTRKCYPLADCRHEPHFGTLMGLRSADRKTGWTGTVKHMYVKGEHEYGQLLGSRALACVWLIEVQRLLISTDRQPTMSITQTQPAEIPYTRLITVCTASPSKLAKQ
jgi:hypothetical protein